MDKPISLLNTPAWCSHTHKGKRAHTYLPTPTHTHAHPCTHVALASKHTHLYDVQASEIPLPHPEVPSPPWHTFVQSPRENPFPLHQVLSTQCYNVARMTNTCFFSLKKNICFCTWKTNSWRFEDRQFMNTLRSVDVPSKEIKLLKPINRQNKPKDGEPCGRIPQ